MMKNNTLIIQQNLRKDDNFISITTLLYISFEYKTPLTDIISTINKPNAHNITEKTPNTTRKTYS
jgi:uncharacterized protein (DUF1697 family)